MHGLSVELTDGTGIAERMEDRGAFDDEEQMAVAGSSDHWGPCPALRYVLMSDRLSLRPIARPREVVLLNERRIIDEDVAGSRWIGKCQ